MSCRSERKFKFKNFKNFVFFSCWQGLSEPMMNFKNQCLQSMNPSGMTFQSFYPWVLIFFFFTVQTLSSEIVKQTKNCANIFKECKGMEDQAVAYVGR